jgi:2-keto-4-pentenoate hydratase
VTRTGRAAAWIAEALSTGNPLADLPPEIAPRGRAEGERVALLALQSLGIAPCGIRVVGGVAGPMIEGRLLPDGATAAPLRHSLWTAALIGVLDRPLEPDDDAPPVLAALHPALDAADHRFTQAPASVALRTADLGGLGFVVAGARLAPPPEALAISTTRVTVADALAPAAAAARRMGGLPAGALLIVAGLSAPLAADGNGHIAIDFGGMGKVTARLG